MKSRASWSKYTVYKYSKIVFTNNHQLFRHCIETAFYIYVTQCKPMTGILEQLGSILYTTGTTVCVQSILKTMVCRQNKPLLPSLFLN